MTHLDKVMNDKHYFKTELINTDIKGYQKVYPKVNLIWKLKGPRYLLKLNMLGYMFHFVYVEIILIILAVYRVNHNYYKVY